MTAIQLLAVLGSLLMAYVTYTALRRRELHLAESVVWMVVWVVLMVVSLFPDRLRALIAPLAVARLLDLVMIAGIFFLAVFVFALNRSLRRLENRIERLVRELALASAGDAPGQSQVRAEHRVGEGAESPKEPAVAEDLPLRELGRQQAE